MKFLAFLLVASTLMSAHAAYPIKCYFEKQTYKDGELKKSKMIKSLGVCHLGEWYLFKPRKKVYTINSTSCSLGNKKWGALISFSDSGDLVQSIVVEKKTLKAEYIDLFAKKGLFEGGVHNKEIEFLSTEDEKVVFACAQTSGLKFK